MKVLCIGDSVVKGVVGANWISMLARRRPNWTFHNQGRNGDTLTRVASRLTDCLERGGKYNAVVLQAGANDILIPQLGYKSWPFRLAQQRLLRQGYHPLEDSRDFETILRETVRVIQDETDAAIILSTIPCLNENPGFVLRGKRAVYNEVIRDVAWDMNCKLADPALPFDEYLERQITRDYFLENFFNTICFDRLRCLTNSPDRISIRRKLHLTIDGVHLNNKGARLFLEEVDKQLLLV